MTPPSVHYSSPLRRLWIRRRRCILTATTGALLTASTIWITNHYW